MKKIKVSIIIPCYNVEKFIEKSILSVINQTLKEIEIIIVNDGSKDKTFQIIKKYSRIDKRIVIVNKKNGGLSSARNVGIKIAKGKYIQHLDGDDWLELDCCKSTYEYAEKNDFDIVCFNLIKDEIKRSYTIDTFKNLRENTVYTNEEFFEELSKKGINANVVAKFIRTDLYLKNNILHPEKILLGEDLFTIIKLGMKSKKIGKINKPFYHYLFNSKSITNSLKGKKMIHLIKGFEECEDYLKEKKIIINNEKGKNLSLLKIKHLGTFLYCKPLMKDSSYNEGVKRFIEFVRFELDDKNLKKIEKKQWILYKIFKLFPNKYFLYFISSVIYYLNLMKRKI